jgi:membrane-associated phospholipid phosphatase
VRQFGCVVDPDAASSAAALLRVDALLGISYFKGVYAAAPYPFGALPSLHNGTAMIVALAAWPIACWKERAGYVAYVTWMLVASLYLDHHWLIDGLAGWTCAAIGIAVATGLARMKVFREAQA